MDEYISKHEAYKMLKDKQAAYMQVAVNEAFGTAACMIDQMKPADVQPVKWVSVNDRLPLIGESVLVAVIINAKLNMPFRTDYTPDIEIGWLEENGKWALKFACADRHKITHWMPLPEPPKGGDAE